MPATIDTVTPSTLSSHDDSGHRLPGLRWPRALVKALHPGHVPKLKAHFLALAGEDRYLRFGFPISDKGVVQYVERMNFERDALFGVFDDHLQLVGVAHLAAMRDDLADPAGHRPAARSAEFGVSVLPAARGMGIGSRLFERAIIHARNDGIEAFFMQCLTVNETMMHIARKAGMHISIEAGEVGAWLTLPHANPGTVVAEAVEEQLAAFDLGLKKQMSSATRWWQAATQPVTPVRR